MNTIDMNTKRVGSFAPLQYQLHHLEQANSPPFMHHNGLANRIGFGTPGSPLGIPGMSPSPSTSTFSSPPPQGHMPVPSPQSTTTGKSDPPKRLRYWLIDMIESGQIPGLRWEDENKTIFRIPWKHAGKNNWKEDDCRIFKAWAEHRGKYKEGVDKFDPATWKTRLRCALNKLPDIKELKDRSQLEGTDPFRVYRLLPEPDRNQEFEIYPRSTWGRENYPVGVQDRRQIRHSEEGLYGQRPYQADPYSRHGDAPMEAMPSQSAIVPVHHGIMNRGAYPLRDDPSTEFSRMRVKDSGHLNVVPPPMDDQELDFQDHSIRPHLSSSDGPIRPPEQHGHGHHHNEVHRTTSNGSSSQRQHQNRGLPIDTSPALINPVASPVRSESAPAPEPICNSLQHPSQMLSHSDQSPHKHELEVYVHYRGCMAMSQHVTNIHGCRIHYGNSGLQHIATVAHELGTHVFGPQDLEQIELVAVEPFATFEKQINLTNHLLKNVQRGLLLSLQDNGTIVAKRLCQSRVFFMSPETNQNEPEKLERNKPTVVFDYKNFFPELRKFAADQYNQMSGTKLPDIEIKISFGQTWSMKNPLDKNLISLVIVPRAANYLLMKVRERHNDMMSINNSILNSGPSSDDRLAERVTRDSEEYVDELISALMKQESQVMDDMKRNDQRGYYQDVDMDQGY